MWTFPRCQDQLYYHVTDLEGKENEISDFRLLRPKRFDTAQVLSTWPFQSTMPKMVLVNE